MYARLTQPHPMSLATGLDFQPELLNELDRVESDSFPGLHSDLDFHDSNDDQVS